MEKKKSVNKITLINLFSTVLLQGIAFISAPIISRLLGTEDYGIISIYTTWVSVAAIAFSGQTSSTLHLAMSEYPKEDQLKYQSSMIGLSITIFLIASAIVAIFSGQISNALNLPSLMLTFLLVQAYGQSCASFLNAKYTYEFDADKNMYMSTFISVSVFALSVLFIINMPLSIRYWGRIAAMTMVYALIGVICSVFLFKREKHSTMVSTGNLHCRFLCQLFSTVYRGSYWGIAIELCCSK